MSSACGFFHYGGSIQLGFNLAGPKLTLMNIVNFLFCVFTVRWQSAPQRLFLSLKSNAIDIRLKNTE